MTVPIAFTRYSEALAAGDMAGLAASLHPAVVWHQPGRHSLAGDHAGPEGVLELLGGFMQRSNGTFALQPTGQPMVNGDLVSLPVAFSASSEGRDDLQMTGVDLFRVADDLIAEVWLFSADQDVEDAFWG